MRIFQNVGIYPSYATRLSGLIKNVQDHRGMLAAFLDDRFEATHLLEGVLNKNPACVLSVGNCEPFQKKWASEHGIGKKASLLSILLAQIEEHRAEVFYNLDPVRFDDRILKQLPACVKRTIAWSAAPTPHMRFQGYDLIVNNFPGILKKYADKGCRTAYFFPSYDPEMLVKDDAMDRPIDILFVGCYSRHHLRRSGILEAVAKLAPAKNVCYHFAMGRLNRLAELPGIEKIDAFEKYRRPQSIRAVAQPAIFGRDLYRALKSAKIVLNAAVDMAGSERGNIRCFEAMGCGALLLSDSGSYPEGMTSNETLVTYQTSEDALHVAKELLVNHDLRRRIANAGHQMLVHRYSKTAQWAAFKALAA